MEKLNQPILSSFSPRSLKKFFLVGCVATLAACGGGGGGDPDINPPPSVKFDLAVNVSGLVPGSESAFEVTNGDGIGSGNSLLVPANGAYKFSISSGMKYNIQVPIQPPGQICTVTNGTGVGAETMTPVSITCSAVGNTHLIGGMLSGLEGSQVVLQNNDTEALTVKANGQTQIPFQFTNRVAHNSGYKITILAQPTNGQNCEVAENASGGPVTVDVNNVKVVCKANTQTFPISGTLSGLDAGKQVVLNYLNVSGAVVESLPVSVNSPPSFAFVNPVPFNGYYKIVAQNPAGQICSVSNDTGNNVQQPVTIAVTCVADNSNTTYTVSATLSGLASGTQITLNNGDDNLTLTPNDNQKTIPFPTPVVNGGSYNVTIVDNDTFNYPLLQQCTVTNGQGKSSVPVTVSVACKAAPVKSITSFPFSATEYYPVGLMQAKDGTFYGTATARVSFNQTLNDKTGYIFTMTNDAISPSDKWWWIVGSGPFVQQDPSFPTGIMQAKDGTIFGTTFLAGTKDKAFADGGAIFKLSPPTFVQNDKMFPSVASQGPIADLIQDTTVENGDLYGMTYGDILVSGTNHAGSIFKRDFLTGNITTLSNFYFSSSATFGARPIGRLLLASDGWLYGVTEKGGENGRGVIFKLNPKAPNPSASFTVIASFDKEGADFIVEPGVGIGGLITDPYARPYSGLIQAIDGNLYGVAKYGGPNSTGRIFKISISDGSNKLSTFFPFNSVQGYPIGELLQLDDGYFYGTTQGNGSTNMGIIFRVNPEGTALSIMHAFKGDEASGDGNRPSTRLVFANGSLYGGTQFGGALNQGAIYKLGR